jgi:hypothetical protein
VIRNESEYQKALEQVGLDRTVEAGQRTALIRAGLSTEEVAHAMEPLLGFGAQLRAEVELYERAHRGQAIAFCRRTNLGFYH